MELVSFSLYSKRRKCRGIFTFEMIISASGCPSNTRDNIYSAMNTVWERLPALKLTDSEWKRLH